MVNGYIVWMFVIPSKSSEADEDEHDDDHSVWVSLIFSAIFSKASEEADEDENEDEATWDWRSVVVPASTDKVCC